MTLHALILILACDLRNGSCDPRTEATAILIVVAALVCAAAWWFWRQRW